MSGAAFTASGQLLLDTVEDQLVQETLADAKVSVRQQCVYEDP